MISIEESVVTAMDGSDKELFTFLPYIQQDLWEIGADPETIINLIVKHFSEYQNLYILDLGCGKGAVSIKIAYKLGCKCYGIDAIPEFINEASKKAKELGVENLCEFEIGDIREKVKILPVFDIIILGAIGPVFGNYHATLTILMRNLKNTGIILIDDGYIEDCNDYKHPLMFKKQEILDQIGLTGMQLIEENIMNNDSIKNSDDHIFENIKKRCLELIEKYPAKRKLFENYMTKQIEENDVLENKVICTTMVIKRK